MGLENPLHIIALVVVLLLVFGARRIPEIARSLGTGINEFKDAVSGGGSQTITPAPEQQPPATPQQASAEPAPEPQHHS